MLRAGNFNRCYRRAVKPRTAKRGAGRFRASYHTLKARLNDKRGLALVGAGNYFDLTEA